MFLDLNRDPPDSPLIAESQAATEYTHDWANLTGWTTTGVQVSNNRLYGISGGNPVATARPFAVPAGQVARVTAEIVVNGTGGGTQYVGLNFGGANNGVNASLPNFIGIGLGNTPRRPVMWAGSAFTGLTTGNTDLGGSGLTGTWRAIVTVDEENISLVLRKEDGSDERSFSCLRSAAPNGGAVTSILVWNGAPNGTNGHYVKAIGVRNSLTPFVTKTNAAGVIEGNTDFVYVRNVTDRWRIHIPASYALNKTHPVILYMHQATTGDANTPWDEARSLPVTQALTSAGFIVLSCDDGGDRWGNAASQQNHEDLLRWVQDRFLTGRVGIFSPSAGAMPAWNSVLMNDLDVAAIAAVCPVCDLDAMEMDPTFTSSVRAAYGASTRAEYLINSAGYNPVNSPNLAKFRDKAVKFYVATGGDSVVPNAAHVDVFEPLVDDFARLSVVTQAGTGHLVAAQYQAADVVAFFSQYL